MSFEATRTLDDWTLDYWHRQCIDNCDGCYNPAADGLDLLTNDPTTRLALRRISDDDVDAMFEVFSDAEVMRYWSTPPLADRAGAVELVNEIHDSFARQVMLKWGVARRADDLLIGTTTLYNLDFDNRRAELGYALGRTHWGQGYMHEALQALLALCL